MRGRWLFVACFLVGCENTIQATEVATSPRPETFADDVDEFVDTTDLVIDPQLQLRITLFDDSGEVACDDYDIRQLRVLMDFGKIDGKPHRALETIGCSRREVITLPPGAVGGFAVYSVAPPIHEEPDGLWFQSDWLPLPDLPTDRVVDVELRCLDNSPIDGCGL